MTFKEELESLLKKELNILKSLKELSFKKTDFIINNQIKELDQTTKEEEVLVNEMGNLEREREKLLDSWGLEKSAPLSHVIENIPEGKEELANIKDELTKELGEISLRNNMNNDLIKDSLEWIDFNMNLITTTQSPTTYGKGNEGDGKNSIFDRKV